MPAKRPKNAMGRQKWRLWHIDPRCYWCHVETVLTYPRGGKPPDALATIDHLRARHNDKRQEPLAFSGERRHVLACWKCNNERDKIEYSRLSLEELRKRSAGSRRADKKNSRNPGLSGLFKRYKRRIKRLWFRLKPTPRIWAMAALSEKPEHYGPRKNS